MFTIPDSSRVSFSQSTQRAPEGKGHTNLKALHSEMVCYIFACVTGAQLAEIFGFYKLQNFTF